MKPICRFDLKLILGALCLLAGWSQACLGQAPTIEESGLLPTGAATMSKPGSMDSLLGTSPGSSGGGMGTQPGRGDMLFGRLGASSPRVPTSIMTPGGVYQGPPTQRLATSPQPVPVPRAPFYGTLEIPKHEGEEGPANGLTLDQAIELLMKHNLDLLAKRYELPQARADVLTASLRANPIFYADTQLVPYGSDSVRRPDGPTQYDVNISHPIDYSHKRQARMNLAARALQVMEAQYQNEARLAMGAVANAYLDVLAARETVHYAQTSVQGMTEILRINKGLFEKSKVGIFSSDVDQARADLEIASSGLLDAQEILRRTKVTLGELLVIGPDDAERIEPRASIADRAAPPASSDELVQLALASRADAVAFRLGVNAAESNLQLQRANRFSDAYVLFQPYTYQNNSPYGRLSGASWAFGITVPLPIYNRNQGNIERARLNIDQSRVQMNAIERKIVAEVRQAYREYEISRRLADRLRTVVMPPLDQALRDRLRLFEEGEAGKLIFHETQRKYNDTAKAYLDAVVRHRRSMLALNTAVGQRILP